MKAKPGQISVATAGVTSAGHNAMELISKVTGVKYRHVTYDGGNPAVVATVSGEADVTTQLAVEQADMIRGKRLRPLATVSDKPLELEGYGTIPPLSQDPARLHRAGQLLRHLHSQGRARRSGEDDREDLGREHLQERGAEEIRHRAAAPCSRRCPATRRRRPCSPRSRPTPGCCSTAARPRSRPTRSAFPSPDAASAGIRAMSEPAASPTEPAAPRPTTKRRSTRAATCTTRWAGSRFGVAVADRLAHDGPARAASTSTRTRCPGCCRACSGIAMILLGGILAAAQLAPRRARAAGAGAHRRRPASSAAASGSWSPCAWATRWCWSAMACRSGWRRPST